MHQTTDEEFPLKVAEPTADWHLANEREQVRFDPADSRWHRFLAWVFLATGFAFYLFIRQTPQSEVSFTVATTQGILLIALSQGLLYYLYRRHSNYIDVGTGLRRLKSKVPEDVDLPVDVEFVHDGSVTGRDRGFIWLDDGTWFFKGLQTSFRFNQQDVVPVEAWPRKIAPDPSSDKPPRVLPMKSVHGPFLLKISVVDPYEDLAKRRRVKGFYREMFDWLQERPRGAIESLLPPTTVHPQLVRTGRDRFGGLVGAVLMVGVNTAVLAGLPRATPETNLGNFGLLAALGVTGLVFFSVRLAWLEARDLIVRSRLSRQD